MRFRSRLAAMAALLLTAACSCGGVSHVELLGFPAPDGGSPKDSGVAPDSGSIVIDAGGAPDGATADAGCVDTTPFPSAGGASAITTFNSIGLYWSPSSGSTSATCSVRFRRAGDCDWRDGLDLWFDARNGE